MKIKLTDSFIHAFIHSVPWTYSLQDSENTEMETRVGRRTRRREGRGGFGLDILYERKKKKWKPVSHPYPTSQLAREQTHSVVNTELVGLVGRRTAVVSAPRCGKQDVDMAGGCWRQHL